LFHRSTLDKKEPQLTREEKEQARRERDERRREARAELHRLADQIPDRRANEALEMLKNTYLMERNPEEVPGFVGMFNSGNPNASEDVRKRRRGRRNYNANKDTEN